MIPSVTLLEARRAQLAIERERLRIQVEDAVAGDVDAGHDLPDQIAEVRRLIAVVRALSEAQS